MLIDLGAGGVLPGSNLSWDIEYFDFHFLLCVCVLSVPTDRFWDHTFVRPQIMFSVVRHTCFHTKSKYSVK